MLSVGGMSSFFSLWSENSDVNIIVAHSCVPVWMGLFMMVFWEVCRVWLGKEYLFRLVIETRVRCGILSGVGALKIPSQQMAVGWFQVSSSLSSDTRPLSGWHWPAAARAPFLVVTLQVKSCWSKTKGEELFHFVAFPSSALIPAHSCSQKWPPGFY